jgi:hypothetical protein
MIAETKTFVCGMLQIKLATHGESVPNPLGIVGLAGDLRILLFRTYKRINTQWNRYSI